MNFKSILILSLMLLIVICGKAQMKFAESSIEVNYLSVKSKSSSMVVGNTTSNFEEVYQTQPGFFISQEIVFPVDDKIGIGLVFGGQYLSFQRNSEVQSAVVFQGDFQMLTEEATEEIDVGYIKIGAKSSYQITEKLRIGIGVSSSVLAGAKNKQTVLWVLDASGIGQVSDFREYEPNQSGRGFNTAITWLDAKLTYQLLGQTSIYLSSRSAFDSIFIEENQIGGKTKYQIFGFGVTYNWIK